LCTALLGKHPVALVRRAAGPGNEHPMTHFQYFTVLCNPKRFTERVHFSVVLTKNLRVILKHKILYQTNLAMKFSNRCNLQQNFFSPFFLLLFGQKRKSSLLYQHQCYGFEEKAFPTLLHSESR